jgi:predicted esterase
MNGPRAALGVLLLLTATQVIAQQNDPNLAVPNQVVTVNRGDYTITGLVTHAEGAKTFKYGIALFPGSPGIMKITEENGQPRYGQSGNFVIRSRRQWLDEQTLVVAVDAPSDQWNFFNHLFRATPRYGADVKALLDEVTRRYGIENWTFVGTSEGSVTAFHAARMNPGIAKHVILTSSLFLPSRNGPGLSTVDWDELRTPILWVHHADDACRYTPYGEARRLAEKTHSPLVTVRGGGPYRGDPCEPFYPHGFVGLEREVVLAMRSWVKSGAVPADIGR